MTTDSYGYWPVLATPYKAVPLSAYCTTQIRATNQECHGQELNPEPPTLEASSLPISKLKVYEQLNNINVQQCARYTYGEQHIYGLMPYIYLHTFANTIEYVHTTHNITHIP